MIVSLCTDGWSGTGRAVLNATNKYSNSIGELYYAKSPIVVDDGVLDFTKYPRVNFRIRYDVVRDLLHHQCHLFLFRSSLNNRLLNLYKQSRKYRRAAWLIDIDCQDPKELLTIFNNKERYFDRYSKKITIYGPTLNEDPEIENKAEQFICEFINHTIAV
jgi:hypothetical protein